MPTILLSLLLASSWIVDVEGKKVSSEIRLSVKFYILLFSDKTCVLCFDLLRYQGELRGLNQKSSSDTISANEIPFEKFVKDPTVGSSAKIDEYIEEPSMSAAATTLVTPPSDLAIKKFKSGHFLKEDSDLPLQEISSSNTFLADGRMYSLDGLSPVNIFTTDATYSEDGEATPLPKAHTFMKREGDTTMLVTQGDGKGEMRTIELVHSDGSVTFMEEVTDGMVATVLPSARDRDMLNKFVMAHLEVDDDDESDGGSPHNDKDGGKSGSDEPWTRKLLDGKSPIESKEGNNRVLQSGCSEFRILEVAIAYESSFCSEMGGSANANAAVQQIVSRASTLYQANFCTKIVISHMEGFCTASSDPYREGVMLNNSGCNGGGLLGFFANFWNRNKGAIRRDAAHLFSGTGLECTRGSCVIGCATTPSLCSSTRSYGVNFITFNRDRQLQSNLFAHELGHNAGMSTYCTNC